MQLVMLLWDPAHQVVQADLADERAVVQVTRHLREACGLPAVMESFLSFQAQIQPWRYLSTFLKVGTTLCQVAHPALPHLPSAGVHAQSSSLLASSFCF